MTLERSSVDSYQALLVLDSWSYGINGATWTASSTADSASLLPRNLGISLLDTAWRSGSLQSLRDDNVDIVTLSSDLSRPRSLNWISFHRHNVRCPWRFRLYRGSPGSSSPDYESEWLDPIVRASLSDFTYQNLEYTLGPDTLTLDSLTDSFRLDSFSSISDIIYAIRSIEIDFDISEISSIEQTDDYLHIGLPLVGMRFQPRINISNNWSLSNNDRSEVHRTEGGSLLGRKKTGAKTISFTMDHLDDSEAFRSIFTNFSMRYGKLGRVFIWVEPTKLRYFYDQSFIGTATQVPSVSMPNYNWAASGPWTIEETN